MYFTYLSGSHDKHDVITRALHPVAGLMIRGDIAGTVTEQRQLRNICGKFVLAQQPCQNPVVALQGIPHAQLRVPDVLIAFIVIPVLARLAAELPVCPAVERCPAFKAGLHTRKIFNQSVFGHNRSIICLAAEVAYNFPQTEGKVAEGMN